MRDEQQRDRDAVPGQGDRLRFDAPSHDVPASAAGGNDPLLSFQAWHGADLAHGERRQSPRYAPAETRAWVGWWQQDHFVVCRGTIVNLSRGGALLLSRRPPMAQPVWLCLGSPHPVESVQARVLEVTVATNQADVADGPPQPPHDHGPELRYATRMVFHQPVPPTFFLAAGRRDDHHNGPRTHP
jgi:hypothetical protein